MKFNIKKPLKKLFKSTLFITLFATTMGVLLALFLNNLNADLKTESRKQVSIESLKKELSANKNDLLESKSNERLVEFLTQIRRLNGHISNDLTLPAGSMTMLLEQYPDYVNVIDSTKTKDNTNTYRVTYTFELTLDAVQNIAWETFKISNMSDEFSYECLQVLVKVYSIQEIFTKEQQKLLNPFVEAEHTKLLNNMLVVLQFKSQLLDAISESEDVLKNCQ